MTKQLSPIRFAIHGDIHGFHRIPKETLEQFIFDATKVGCQFVCLLGDSSDGGYPIVMSLSNSSPVALFYQHGDHEFFGEWSIGGCTRNYKSKRLIGTDKDPIIMAMGGIPRCEAWAGLPRFWSMTYRGVHFVFAFNGKHEVWTPWFLSWLKNDLEENSDFTTVIFSHRGLDEDVGMERSSVEAVRKLLLQFPQVELFCCSHIHRWGLWLLGKLIDVRGEANSQEGWYVLVEIAPDAIRIFHRNAQTGEILPRFYRPLKTSLNDDTSAVFSLPFLMSDGGVVFSPALWLYDAKLRIWGFETEQIILDPFFEKGIDWEGMNGAKVEVVEALEQVREMVSLRRMAKIKVKSLSGTEKNPVKICHIASLPVRFDESSSGESGSYLGGTVYDALIISKLPEGRRLRLLLETYTEDGKLEATHFVDGIGEGDDITAILAKVGMIYIPGVPFRWMGLEGKGEVDGIPTARRATLLEVYLAVPEEVKQAEYLVAAFAYPHEGFYTPVNFGRNLTDNATVAIGGRELKVEKLSMGDFRHFLLDDVPGGEEIRLKCGGSKLAIVELTGKSDGLMHHLLRKVKGDRDKFELLELTRASQELLQIAEFKRHIGVTTLTMFKEAKINGERISPFQNKAIPPDKKAFFSLI